jgi:hypothetical protein
MNWSFNWIGFEFEWRMLFQNIRFGFMDFEKWVRVGIGIQNGLAIHGKSMNTRVANLETN